MIFGKQKLIEELEAKIKGKDLVIRRLKESNKQLTAQSEKELKFTLNVIEVMNNPGTIVDKHDKIKALVADYQSNN